MDQDVTMTGAQPSSSAAPGTAQADPANGAANPLATWNTPKHREEVEAYRQRLTDQGFNASDYGDPLTTVRPLEKIYSRPFPDGTEARLRALIEKK
ncbi:uncharacterized protein SPSK_10063 [Sporothrix schenckii 1099-18]|uniref:Uncharacterized protein n=2 Tax=Sporothrix schenckii TaxID=29908 RepID=U7Q770_SPOS1|nr:uncharacterized protein SPSK_10063 [Sporothrix schenckii 1099-18]ERT03042.1 hypothetical protein HMPREF1624_01347 [Sporothrix schenckii ATCC 58251]KJR84564.1 hypothetical protein SPSK_10063 [Sporothrix schenckii 1099-18]